MKIPFSPPDITQDEVNEVADTLLSGWITTGPKVKKLEQVVASFCNVNNCVCLNSQTACSEMTLRLLGVGPGDEVIVPAYTYTASCSVILHVGATPVLVDSQKDCFEMDYLKLEEAITEKTKVIIPVDLFGVCCDYKKIFEIVNKKKGLFKPNNELQKCFGRIIVLADTAHALGAIHNNMKAGSIADFSCFSFHAVKNMTTAEGGAVTWKNIPGVDNKCIYNQFQLLSLHGQSKDALAKSKAGAWEYDVIGPWYKCNLTDVAAAMGLSQMRRYDSMLKKRQEIVNFYNDSFKQLNIQVLPHLNGKSVSSCHLYVIRLLDFTEEERNRFIEMMAERGVACNVHYKPLPLFTAYKNLGFDIKNYPNAFNLFKNEITIPLYTKLTKQEVLYIVKNFIEVYNSFSK